MSIRWILVPIACVLVTDCGSRSDSDDTSADGSSADGFSADGSNGCEAGYISKNICLACGVAGGCGKMETRCARTCSTADECKDLQLFCSDSVCQVAGCI